MPKLVVVHEDDVGLSHGSNTAFLELSAAGICTAGSVMVPCPWFSEAASLAREHPELDVGVHLTLNSDMHPYKWRPLTGGTGGLVDESGYMWADVKDVRQFASVAAVERELRAQVETALAAGIDVTHLDCHMGTAMMPEFVEVYDRLGTSFNLPLLLMRDYRTFSVMSYVGAVTTSEYETVRDAASLRGNPIVDMQFETPWSHPDGVEAAYRSLFSGIPEGISWLALHFNAPGEIETIDSEAQYRLADYEFFRSGRAAELMDEFQLTPVGVRDWRQRMRN